MSEPPHVEVSALHAALAAQAAASAVDWLDTTVAALGTPPDELKLRIACARVQRKFADGPVLPVSPAGGNGHGSHWREYDLARLVLVLRALERVDASEGLALFRVLLQTGGSDEQVSLLKMLAWLPEPTGFVELAIDACRTNAVPVFAAIANHNAFPAAHFPEANFNQLVLKAIFVEVPVEHIVGLAQRVNPPLVRMARDFADERIAAGRSVPTGVAFVEQLS